MKRVANMRTHGMVPGVMGIFLALLVVCANPFAVAKEALFVLLPHVEGEGEHAWMANGVARFKAANPELEVRLEGVAGGNLPQKLGAYLAAGEAPDVVMMMQRDLGALVHVDFLYDLNDFLSSDPKLKTSDFVGGFLRYWARDGRQLAMPINPDVGYIHYDQDLLAEVGLPMLSQSWSNGVWTWGDFRRTAQRLTRDKNGDGTPEVYGYSASISWDPAWSTWVYSNGGEVFDVKTGRSGLAEPASYEALQFLYELRRDQIMAPFGPGTKNRRVAGMETLPAHWGQYHAAAGARVSSFVHPGASQTRNAVHNILGPGLLMFKSGRNQNPELAWKLIAELMSHQSMVELAELTNRLPARLSAFSAWTKLYETKQADARYVLTAVESGRGMPYSTKWAEQAPIIRTAVSQIWQGQKSAQAAMESVSQQIEALFR